MVSDTPRIRIDLGYVGTHFHGWAKQPGLRTVQQELETALAGVCGTTVTTVVGGRTDAGVHARRQTVHADLPHASGRMQAARSGHAQRSLADVLRARLRGTLHKNGCGDMVIHGIREVDADFDARFSARWRRYEYRLAEPRSFLDPATLPHTAVTKYTLDTEAMAQAAHKLVGMHDFLAFAKPRVGSTTIRNLLEFTVRRDPDEVIVCGLSADAFCHHMVRGLMGALVHVGRGLWPVDYPREQLELAEQGCPRSDLEPLTPMPAQGLTLCEIGYAEPGSWAQQAQLTRRRRERNELRDSAP